MATTPLIVIVGPTSSGKSGLAIELAQRFNGEIICADSRTIYRGMNVGTAKPSKADQAKVPHHILDVIAPDQKFSVAIFKRMAIERIDDIQHRGRLPILVGGSGLYVDSIIYDYDFADLNDSRDANNPRHLAAGVRSLPKKVRPDMLIIGIDPGQEILKERIKIRIRSMLKNGLVEEAKGISEKFGWEVESMKTYLPLKNYINNQESLEEAARRLITKDKQLAKKQRTWFKRNKSIHWLSSPQEVIEITTDFLNNRP